MTATVRRSGDDRAYVPPEPILRLAGEFNGPTHVFSPHDLVVSKRVFPPGDYTVAIEGPDVERATVQVTVPALSDERTTFFGDYVSEILSVDVRVRRSDQLEPGLR